MVATGNHLYFDSLHGAPLSTIPAAEKFRVSLRGGATPRRGNLPQGTSPPQRRPVHCICWHVQWYAHVRQPRGYPEIATALKGLAMTGNPNTSRRGGQHPAYPQKRTGQKTSGNDDRPGRCALAGGPAAPTDAPEHFRKNEPGKKHRVTIQDRVGAHRLSALPTTPKQCKY